MSGSLHGQRALVTGSTRGIGMAVADALAEAGADLVLTARGTAELKTQQKTRTARHGIRAQVLTADLADAAAVETLARAGLDSFNGLDILVNNAGISNPQPAVDIRVDSWDEVMAVNLRAPALLAARIGQAMSAVGGGRIINIASAAGVRALTDHYAYCTSKAGLVMAPKCSRSNSVPPE
ncbi:MAG: SDR family oxidoreductase [Frankiaceae bacterium]